MSGIKRLEQEHFDCPTGGTHQVQPGRQHFGVVHHQHIALTQQLCKVAHHCIAWRTRPLVD